MAIITISRGSMSGGEALAKRLAERLHYPLLGREILVEAATKAGVSEEELTQKFERSPGLWDRMTSSRRLYIAAVQTTLAEHASAGDLVYHGNAGHLLLRPIASVLRVRLIAPLEVRVRSVMEKQHITRDAAVEYIHTVDAERTRWTKFLYGVDWTDPTLYDVMVNAERMSLDTACEMIAQAAARSEFAITEAVNRGLTDFWLGCRVKLALASNIQTRAIDFEVRAVGGTVEIFGEMPTAGMLTHASTRSEAEVTEVVQSVPGVQKVLLSVKKVDAYH